MRPLEALLIFSLGVSVISLFVEASRRNRWLHLLPAFSLAIVGIHLIIEGYRWQMVPAYVLAWLLFLFTLRNIPYAIRPWLAWQSTDHRIMRIIGASAGSLLFLDILFLQWFVPLFELPQPTGPYTVGTRYFYAVDTSREEEFTEQPGDHRAVSAEVWYPANPGKMDKVKCYMQGAEDASPALGTFMGLPSFVFSHLCKIKTHSYLDADILAGSRPYPVLVFSHAFAGNIVQNTLLMEDLASHGYIIFSVGHAYETPFIYKADGSVILYDPQNDAYRARLVEIDDPTSNTIKSEVLTTLNLDLQARLYRQLMLQNRNLVASVRTWAEDNQFLMDQMVAMNQPGGIFAGQMDLEQIGLLGHSLGGAAAGQTCFVDARCKAGVNIDGFQYGDVLEGNLLQPFMFLYSASTQVLNKNINDVFYDGVQNDAYSLVMNGATHEDFSDIPLYFRMQLLGAPVEDRNPLRFIQIENAYILAFFDQYLYDRPSPLLAGPSSKYPEVTFKSHGF
jgi:predicted dienelactone hydrolase